MRVGANALAALLCLPIATFAIADPPPYRAVPITGFEGPVAINEAGTVVGTNTSPMRAWIARRGEAATLLPLPPGMSSSWANDINEAGVIVGAAGPAFSPEFGGKAIAWVPAGDGHLAIVLGTLPGHVASDATAINNPGDIVGYSSNGPYRTAVTFSTAAPPVSLAATGLFDPQDVNDDRIVVDRSFYTRRLDLDTMQVDVLPTPGAGYLSTTATAINAGGRICGIAIRTSTTCDREAAEFTDRTGWEILSICGPYNGAIDLNDRGDVVFSAQLQHFVRFDGAASFPIQSLAVDEAGPWFAYSFTPIAINDRREIVLNMSQPATGVSGAIRLVPLGPPADLDGDGAVAAGDLAMLLASWGKCPGCAADLDGDGAVGSGDLADLLAAWTPRS